MAYEQYVDEIGVQDLFASDAALDQRMAFIRRTYMHLLGAIIAFIGLEAFIFTNVNVFNAVSGLFSMGFLPVLIAFMVASWLANKWATSGASEGLQYFGLALFVLAEAIIFVPILAYASMFGGPNLIPNAAIITLTIFGGLTAFVFLTKKDFSFLGGILWMGGFGAIGLVLIASFTGITLGSGFAIAMIGLLAGFILYDTSNVLHHYRTDQHVAASLALFSSVATLFWYVLRLMSIFGDD